MNPGKRVRQQVKGGRENAVEPEFMTANERRCGEANPCLSANNKRSTFAVLLLLLMRSVVI